MLLIRFALPAYSSLWAVDSETTCCFLVQTFRQYPPPMVIQRVNTLSARHSAASGTSTLLLASQRSIF